jgi:hypothetical protein
MAVGTGYSKVTTNGLTFAYDTGDTYNSYLGRPTTNILANAGMSIYNNVPGSVSATLTTTGETYRGAPVYVETLTALDGSGASWLSGCNNPGIGVVTSGGGGTGGVYTGHSIFFKPTVPMCGCPCYTNYSNIGGWQSNCNIENMGDGWFRAYVLWYDTVSRSDGKYWAINPASTSVGQTVTIYWAGPFREDLNSTTISQFVNGTRSTSQAVVDIGAGRSMTVNNNPFTSPAINPQLNFDGSDDYLDLTPSSVASGNEISVEFVCAWNGGLQYNSIIAGGAGGNQDLSLHLPWSDGVVYWDAGRPFNRINKFAQPSEYLGNHHWVCTKNANTGIMEIYLDGNLWHSGGGLTSSIPSLDEVNIGRYTNGSFRGYYYKGNVYVAKIYSRALTAGEVRDNYNHYKTRFNLP